MLIVVVATLTFILTDCFFHNSCCLVLFWPFGLAAASHRAVWCEPSISRGIVKSGRQAGKNGMTKGLGLLQNFFTFLLRGSVLLLGAKLWLWIWHAGHIADHLRSGLGFSAFLWALVRAVHEDWWALQPSWLVCLVIHCFSLTQNKTLLHKYYNFILLLW